MSASPAEQDVERGRLVRVDDLRERILAAGYWCFDHYGVERTSVEQICDLASISRPTFYRYFNNKQKLLEHIQELESIKVRSEVRRRIGHDMGFADMLVEALFLIERAARANPYISGFLFSIDTASSGMNFNSPYHELQKEWWGPFLERARANGQIADDLSHGEIVAWLSSSMVLLMLRQRFSRPSAAELKQYIRRYLIAPLLPGAALRQR